MIIIRWGDDRPHCGHDSPLGGRLVGRRLASERRAMHHLLDRIQTIAKLATEPIPRSPDDGWVPLPPMSPAYEHPGHDVCFGCSHDPLPWPHATGPETR